MRLAGLCLPPTRFCAMFQPEFRLTASVVKLKLEASSIVVSDKYRCDSSSIVQPSLQFAGVCELYPLFCLLSFTSNSSQKWLTTRSQRKILSSKIGYGYFAILPTPWLGHRIGHRLSLLPLPHIYIEALEPHSINRVLILDLTVRQLWARAIYCIIFDLKSWLHHH